MASDDHGRAAPPTIHQRHAASWAIDRLVRELGGREQVAVALGVSLRAVERGFYNAASQRTLRRLLAYLQCDIDELTTVGRERELPPKPPLPPIEEAILCAARFTPRGVESENEIRVIAFELRTELADLPPQRVLERLFQAMQTRIFEPERQARRIVRQIQGEQRSARALGRTLSSPTDS